MCSYLRSDSWLQYRYYRNVPRPSSLQLCNIVNHFAVLLVGIVLPASSFAFARSAASRCLIRTEQVVTYFHPRHTSMPLKNKSGRKNAQLTCSFKAKKAKKTSALPCKAKHADSSAVRKGEQTRGACARETDVNAREWTLSAGHLHELYAAFSV